jgi:hypothetical protein
MSLEYNLGVKSVRNKSDLLDKYAMLALPGTSLDMISHTNGISQARLLNFNKQCQNRVQDLLSVECGMECP